MSGNLILFCCRFTADVRSVLSRNLHQHRLWWLAESRGGGACWPASSSLAGFHPALRSHTDDPPALSEPLRRVLRRWGLGWPPKTGWTVRDHQSPKLLRRDGGATLFFFFYFFFFLILYLYFFFFFFKTKRSLSALSLLILTVCVWRWACVHESEYACWVR